LVLGIDPGTNITGYGLVQASGSNLTLVHYGIIDLRKLSDDHAVKLKRIFERVSGLVAEFMPDEVALEAPFFGKNVQSMLKLGRAQGVAMAAALERDIPVVEYAPKKVKIAITGNGNASKEQVNAMLQHILKFQFDHNDLTLDASDGLAVAVCHLLQKHTPAKSTTRKKKGASSSWASFIKDNPDRLK
jgi:crossover junction endodeoxyribonuclease RuvC